MYFLLVAAAMLYAAQFVFHQKFEKLRGSEIDASLLFQMSVGICIVVYMFLLNGFRIRVTLFSLIMAMVLAIDIMCYVHFSMKAFMSCNLSVFSIFAMLGGMLLPFGYGIIFCKEEITVAKVICCIAIIISLALTFEKGNKDMKNRKYYLAVFVFNGLSGVISSFHQSHTHICTDSISFVAMAYAGVFGISLVWYFIRNKKVVRLNRKEFKNTLCYAVCNGTAVLFALTALTELPTSVQYPIITGGVIFFSTIVCITTEKRIIAREICSAIVALIAACVIAV